MVDAKFALSYFNINRATFDLWITILIQVINSRK